VYVSKIICVLKIKYEVMDMIELRTGTSVRFRGSGKRTFGFLTGRELLNYEITIRMSGVIFRSVIFYHIGTNLHN
jgi:hypothetical protein